MPMGETIKKQSSNPKEVVNLLRLFTAGNAEIIAGELQKLSNSVKHEIIYPSQAWRRSLVEYGC